jgi:hypothetical protein
LVVLKSGLVVFRFDAVIVTCSYTKIQEQINAIVQSAGQHFGSEGFARNRKCCRPLWVLHMWPQHTFQQFIVLSPT